MSVKLTKKSTKVNQWHSWRPAWMSNLLILTVILFGAVGLLLTSINKDAVSGVASVFNANAASFACSGVSAAEPTVINTTEVKTSDANANWDGPSGKCNHNWIGWTWLIYHKPGDSTWHEPDCASGGLCESYHPSATGTSIFQAGSYHSFTSTFTPSLPDKPCHYAWAYRFAFLDGSGHKYPSTYFQGPTRKADASC